MSSGLRCIVVWPLFLDEEICSRVHTLTAQSVSQISPSIINLWVTIILVEIPVNAGTLHVALLTAVSNRLAILMRY